MIQFKLGVVITTNGPDFVDESKNEFSVDFSVDYIEDKSQEDNGQDEGGVVMEPKKYRHC